MAIQKRVLSRFTIFEPLAADELARLARAAQRMDVPAKTVLFEEGSDADVLYLIQAGVVEIYSPDSPAENRLNVLHAGDWFGELSLIDGHPRSASARALTHCTLITLPQPEFLWLISAYPLALYRLAAITQQRLRERDRAYEAEMRARLAQLEQLHETALDITRHLDRDQALEAIRERAIELLRSAGGNLYLYDARQNLLLPQGSVPQDTAPRRPGEGCTGLAFSTGEAQIEKWGRQKVMFELAAPIRMGAQPLGVLSVYRASDGAPYVESDRTLLELFASQAAIVIENADLHKTRLAKERLDTELNDARRVQRRLIPSEPPHIRGYQVAALWHPANQVSGDYYDFIPLPGARWGLTIADVTGKGLDSALFMANTRSTLRASAAAGDSADAIVTRANHALSLDSSAGMFVTLFFGILDPRGHTFSYVNAGHNLPWLWRAGSGTLEELPGGYRALGITADYPYAARELTLEPGDLLVLYTDGVTEATASDDTLFGDARLAEAVRERAGNPARSVLRHIDERVRAFTAAQPQSDDITAVVLRRN